MSWFRYDEDPFMTYMLSGKTSPATKGRIIAGQWNQYYAGCGCGWVIDPAGDKQEQFCWCPQHPKKVDYPALVKKPTPKPSPPSYWPAREQFVKSTDWETARKYYDLMIEAIEANPPDMDSEQYRNRWAEPALPKKKMNPVWRNAPEVAASLICMLLACLFMAGVI